MFLNCIIDNNENILEEGGPLLVMSPGNHPNFSPFYAAHDCVSARHEEREGGEVGQLCGGGGECWLYQQNDEV